MVHMSSRPCPHHGQRRLLCDSVDVVDSARLEALVLVQCVQHLTKQYKVLQA